MCPGGPTVTNICSRHGKCDTQGVCICENGWSAARAQALPAGIITTAFDKNAASAARCARRGRGAWCSSRASAQAATRYRHQDSLLGSRRRR